MLNLAEIGDVLYAQVFRKRFSQDSQMRIAFNFIKVLWAAVSPG